MARWCSGACFVAVIFGSLACGADAGAPVSGAPTVEAPVPAPAPAKGRGGKKKAAGCEGGTHACSDATLMFCEGGAFQAEEDCGARGDFWSCFELGNGRAECRQANGM